MRARVREFDEQVISINISLLGWMCLRHFVLFVNVQSTGISRR